LEASQETKREGIILKAFQEVIAERGIKSKDINVCAPGFHVFSKFVKLPPVEPSKVTQIIQYEAQQNVPFPLAEVVWDYQILSTSASGELEVLLVAIKSDIVEGLFRVAETAGLHLQLCDVSPAALCNAFRYNYGELEDCTMLLDIGAKTSNLLFFEKGKVFSRSINLGANSITQDFANESKLKFENAEKIKIDEGFVSLGGAYEEPENAHQAAISKIARQFMTRLHIQVNQTLQFYRGQQGGSAPQRLFLSGGASLMPYTAQFFAEKLNVPVEYFNPLRAVQIDPTVNLEELARVAHSLGEVVGLGLRNLAHCPVELNLMPESTLRWQSFNQKKPFFIATLASLVLMAFAVGYLFEKLAAVNRDQAAKLQATIEPLQRDEVRFKKAYGELKTSTNNLAQVITWMEDRYFWVDLMREVRRSLISVERKTKEKLKGSDVGVWVEHLTTIAPAFGTDPNLGVGGAPSMPPTEYSAVADPRFGQRPPPEFAESAPSALGAPGVPAAPGGALLGAAGLGGLSATGETEIKTVTLTFRAVSLTQIEAAANPAIAYALHKELQECPLFVAEETKLSDQIINDDATGTFTFSIMLALKQPLKL